MPVQGNKTTVRQEQPQQQQQQRQRMTTEPREIPIRTVLLLGDDWTDAVEGHVAINKALSLSLTGYEGIRVCCATLRTPDEFSLAEASKAQVQLVSLTSERTQDLKQLYDNFNDNPQTVWKKQALGKVPEASFIIGHWPGTAEAATKLRDSIYPSSKVILFFHVIPDDLEWLADKLPYRLPSDNDLVRLAERADVVYSVTTQVHSFFEAKFRNRAQKTLDHRLYVPQCPRVVFDVEPERDRRFSKTVGLRVLVLGCGVDDWQGLDIAASAVAKVGAVLRDRGGPSVSLTVGGVPHGKREIVRTALAALTDGNDLKLDVKTYKEPGDQFRDVAKHHLCLVPSRAEPFGYGGLLPISAGIPTLIAEDSYLASLVKRLTVDPSQFLVRTTRDAKACKQDAGLWRDRILELVDEKAASATFDRTQLLKTALKRDEVTIQTHDNLVTYCLRGIQLKVEVAQLDFLQPNDSQHEAETRRRLTGFLVALLRQSWRLKRHSLISSSADLQPLLTGIDIPIEKVIKNVTDKVEDLGRRIVAVDDASGSLFVYCPDRKALRDLWSMSDRINKAMTEVLLKGDKLAILGRFKLREASTKLVIPGPEFLKHNEELLLAENN